MHDLKLWIKLDSSTRRCFSGHKAIILKSSSYMGYGFLETSGNEFYY